MHQSQKNKVVMLGPAIKRESGTDLTRKTYLFSVKQQLLRYCMLNPGSALYIEVGRFFSDFPKFPEHNDVLLYFKFANRVTYFSEQARNNLSIRKMKVWILDGLVITKHQPAFDIWIHLYVLWIYIHSLYMNSHIGFRRW